MTAIRSPDPMAAGTQLLGEVISWTCSGVTVTHAALMAALKEAGLDENVARELAPRHAFTRACKKLSDQRIIRQVGEDEATVRFQFTAEHREGDKFEYQLETMLTLDKRTGRVTCDLPGLATLFRIVRSLGSSFFAERDAATAAYRALPLVERKGVTGPDLAVVGVDGGRLQIVEHSARARWVHRYRMAA